MRYFQSNTMEQNVNFDYQRGERTGIPEAIFCEGKTKETILGLLEKFSSEGAPPVLFTRLAADIFHDLKRKFQKQYRYDETAGVAFRQPLNQEIYGKVAIVSAGTSDANVAWEAAKTLEYLGIRTEVFEDCGVAGLWRLQARLAEINDCQVIIAIAGMEGALVSVLAGLTPRPIIGVPTSIGYGVCEKGKTALRSMLSSCAPGISVVNIDNGYGAACFAAKILMTFSSIQP